LFLAQHTASRSCPPESFTSTTNIVNVIRVNDLRERHHFKTNSIMAPKELNFITTSKNKFAETQAILSVTPVQLQNQSLDIPELQGTIEDIAKGKCRRAAELVCMHVHVAIPKLSFHLFSI
jgi:hypothetical protein